MNIRLKIQRCNFLPEGEMAIVKDTNTLIHNIVNSELKEKDKKIDRLLNIIKELEEEINNQLTMTRRLDKYNEGYFDATLNYYNKLNELKEGK